MKRINEIEIKKEGNVKKTERAELLSYFYEKLAPSWTKGKLTKTYFGMKTSHLKLPDLYFLKSVCDDAEKFGRDFSTTFWARLKV